MTLTLYKSQVHCSGVMQWWACVRSFACKSMLRSLGADCWSLLCNNNMATNLWRLTSSYYGNRRFAEYYCWTQTSGQVIQRDSDCW